jgi:hypothetical protein
MTTAYTSLLGLALPVTGELSGTWGDTVNNSITSLLDSAISGTTTISTDADITLTTTTGAANEAREAIILWTAGGTVTRNITAPAQSKTYIVINKSSSTQSIVLRGAGPTTGVTIIKGEAAVCAWNGTDFIKVSNISGPGTFTDLTVTGVASFADGTAALPSITNTGDTNTGIYFPAADTIAFTEGGVESMRIDSSGNVGIGTASPTVKLQVTTASSAALPASSGTTLSAGTLIRLGSSADAAGGIGTIGLATNQMWIQATDQTNLAVSYQLLLNPNGGNVGIGTSSPATALEINGGSTAANFLLNVNAGTYGKANDTSIEMATSADATPRMLFRVNGNNERMRIDSSGNVGIGTSSPSTEAAAARLALVGTAAQTASSLATSNTKAVLSLRANSNSGYSLAFGTVVTTDEQYIQAVNFNGGAASTNLLLQPYGGNVGIGTSSPSQKLTLASGFVQTGNGIGGAGGVWFPYGGDAGSRSWRARTDNVAYGDWALEQSTTQTGTTFATKFLIDPSGNVGIGTSSPVTNLNISSASAATGGDGIQYVQTTYTGTGTVNSGYTAKNYYGTSQFFQWNNNGTRLGNRIITNAGGGNLVFTYGNDTEGMRIDSSGNVGIGTSSPSSKLTVNNGNVEIQSGNSLLIRPAGNSNDTRLVALTTGGLDVVWGGATSTSIMNWSNGGNVGIGTTSPSELFSIYKASGDPAFKNQSSAGSIFIVNRSATSAMDLLNSMNGPMTFATNNAERMRIDSSGNVLVGTTTSSAKFNVISSGDVSYFETSGSTATCSYFKVPGTTAYYALFQNSSGANIGSIRTTDGTTVQYNTSSDYRLKDNVAPMTGALVRVASLKPCTYTWKSTGQASQGFIAHELQAVVPECVSGEKDAVDADGKPVYQGIDVSFLVATLTAAIQELKAEFDAYKSTHP